MPKRRLVLEESSDRKCRRRVVKDWDVAGQAWKRRVQCGKPSHYRAETWIDTSQEHRINPARGHWRKTYPCKEHGLEWARKHDVEIPKEN